MEKEESLQKNPATVLLGAPRAHPPVAENWGKYNARDLSVILVKQAMLSAPSAGQEGGGALDWHRLRADDLAVHLEMLTTEARPECSRPLDINGAHSTPIVCV